MHVCVCVCVCEHMHACVAGSREMLVLTCLQRDSRGNAFQFSVVPGDGILSLSHTSSWEVAVTAALVGTTGSSAKSFI